jgi:benzoyl-CoA-dihydrodiol lyase
VTLEVDPDKRVGTLTLQAPRGPQPVSGAEYLEAGDSAWALRCFRELDDCLCRLRFEQSDIGLVRLETRGNLETLLQVERDLASQDHWLTNEIVLLMARVLRRYDLTARSFFAIVDRESCFAGSFLELALASDRIYALEDPDEKVEMAIGPLAGGALPMSNGMTRLQNRFLGDPDRAERLAREQMRFTADAADEQGLVTFMVDELDWDDELRIAMEERASLSPDALTGMEASLRFGGAETCDSKIFGRLSAWQNWIFTRPNATGEEGALVRYGQPESARFDWRRT